MAIIHIYGDGSIFLLFCNHQDIECEWREIKIGISGPICTPKNIRGFMGQWYPYPKTWEKHIPEIILIYGARAISLLFYDKQDTESESQEI